jgi:hypothetical protein
LGHSSVSYSQTDADFSSFIIGEVNAGLFKGFLYLEGGGEVSFHLLRFARRPRTPPFPDYPKRKATFASAPSASSARLVFIL